jgi:predicted regulator of Ras-like GTPase activity (Roadblock/LC7/MglB family)
MALIGNLDDVDVPSVIELARQSREYARLSIRANGQVFILHIRNGEVVHAENEHQNGIPVLYQALSCKSGTFELEKGGTEPARPTIDVAWNSLLLQYVQQQDENRQTPPPPFILQEDPAMAAKERLEDILKEMGNDIEPGLRGIGVAGTDGLGIAFHKVTGEAAETLSSQIALIMQLSRRSADRLERSSVEDVLVTTDKSYLLGRFLGEGSYFVVVSVDRDSVLGNVRLTLRTYADRVLRAIPGAK